MSPAPVIMTDFHDRIWQVHKDWCYGNPVILYGLIRSMKPQVVVEVGTYRGFSASWMAQALKENGSGHLYCIDNFSLLDHEQRLGVKAREHLETNLKSVGVRDYITILDGDSDRVTWPERVDFSYVDGWHSHDMAAQDFTRCNVRGAECICLDDATQTVGPRLLVQEIRESGQWDVLNVQRDCGMAICMRRTPMGQITFSQELPDHPGVDLQTLTKPEQLAHLDRASRFTGVNYTSIVDALCEGRRE